MEFISLGAVLSSVASCIDLPPRFDCGHSLIGKITPNAADTFWHAKELDRSVNEKIEWARKMSIAALYLNNAVLGSPAAPLQWAEFHGEQHIDANSDSLKQEALAMLQHAIGWGARREEKYNSHFRNSIPQGDEALALPVAVIEDEGLTLDGKIPRLIQVGCDREKLIAFLDANDVEHSLEEQAAPASEPVTPAAAPLRKSDEPKEWIAKSVELANAIGLKKWKDGERQITARNIADAVAVKLGEGAPGEPQKYHGSQGPRSAGSIRSVALKGWKFIFSSGIDGIN